MRAIRYTGVKAASLMHRAECERLATVRRTPAQDDAHKGTPSAIQTACHWQSGSGLGGDVRPLRLVLGLAAG